MTKDCPDQMGPKQTAVLFSRKLTLYTVNLAPPGGEFKFLICFCLLKPPGPLSYPTETVLTNKITMNRILLSFKDSLQKPLRQLHIKSDFGLSQST